MLYLPFKAAAVYEAMEKRGKEVSEEVKQDLLELLCFHGCSEAVEEDHNLTSGVANRPKNEWDSGGLAERIYSSMEPSPTPEAREALLRGLSRHGQYNRAWQLYEECLVNGVALSVGGFNGAVRSVPQKGGLDTAWEVLLKVLRQMKDAGHRPTVQTAINVLNWLRSFEDKDRELAKELAPKVMTEFRQAGVSPSLATYYYMSDIFDRSSPDTRQSVAMTIAVAESAQGQDWSQLKSEADIHFLPMLMGRARRALNPFLGQLLETIREHGRNYVLLSDYGDNFKYHRHHLELALYKEPMDVFMKK